MFLRSSVCLGVLACVLCTESLAHAQSEETEEGIVVRGENARRAPSEQSISTSEIRAVPRSSTAELLNLTPGLVLSSHGGEGKAHQYFLRGFDAEHGQDLEFTVAGAPVNDVSNPHGQGYAELFFVPPEVVERVRVLPGPFDVRQGDFAVAGSVRMDLGVSERGYHFGAQYGMFHTARALFIAAPRGLSNETFLAGELARSDGFGPRRASSRASAVGQWLVSLGNNVSLRLFAQGYAGSFETAGVVRVPDYRAGIQDFFASNDPHQGGFSSRVGALAELIWRGQGTFTLTIHGHGRSFRVQENYTGFLLDRRGDRYQQTWQNLTVGANASYQRSFGAYGTFEGGMSVRHDRSTQSMVRERFFDDLPIGTDIDADVEATDIALFAAWESPRWFQRLRIRAGIRADGLAFHCNDRLPRVGTERSMMPVPRGFRDAQGLHVGPRATVTVDLASGWNAQLAYGKGFRSPQALTLGQGEQAPFATVHSGEVGVRFRSGVGEAFLAGFATHIDRDLLFDPTLGQNVEPRDGSATTRIGAAGSVRFVPISGLVFLVSGTWARATFDRSGLLVPYVPPLVGRFDATWERTLGTLRGHPVRASVGLGATFLGYRPVPFGERSDAAGVLDASASARWSFLEVGVQARNLTDARWQDGQFNYPSNFDPNAASSLVPVRHFTAGRPFTFAATLTVHL